MFPTECDVNIAIQNSMSGGGWARAWGGLCTVRSKASWTMVTWYNIPPMNRRTDTTENITFPQIRWQAVKYFTLIKGTIVASLEFHSEELLRKKVTL